MRAIIVGLALVLAVAAVGRADSTVILKDGRKFVGRIIESQDKIGVTTEEGLKIFDRSEVERIDYDAFGRASAGQLDAYYRTVRAAEQVKHPAEALVIWQKYLENCPKDNPLLPEAEKELTRWAEALKSGKVVWAGKLITPQERDGLKAKALEALDKAVAEYRAGRLRQVLPLLREAARSWPDHPGMLFYMGLVMQRDRDPNEAARCYNLVLDAFPDHVPTLNNLAALECTRKQYLVGVPLIMRAAEVAYDVVVVNDNAYRTLLRVEDARLRGFENEVARLRNSCTRFETAMEKQGLARWGTSWVTVEKQRGYEQKNKEIDNQLNDLAAEISAINTEIQVLKARIAELERQKMSAPSEREAATGVDTDGDGVPDYFFPRDALTREKIALMLVDHYGRLAGKEDERIAKLTLGRKLAAERLEPVRELDFVLLESPGDELMTGGPQRPRPVPLVPSFVGPTSVAELVKAIRSGKAIILADDGSFLGKVSADKADPQAILNPSGMFGDAKAEFSLLNPKSKYAAPDSDQSVHNPEAGHPPRLFYEGNLLAYVTDGAKLAPRLRLDGLLAVLRGE